MVETKEHYGIEIPVELFTPKVKTYISMVEDNIKYIEQQIDDNAGKKKTSLKNYLEKVKENVKMAPYRLNNDVYLKKYNEQQEKDNKPTKKRRRTTKK